MQRQAVFVGAVGRVDQRKAAAGVILDQVLYLGACARRLGRGQDLGFAEPH